VKTVTDAVAQAPTVATQSTNLNSTDLYNTADLMGAARVAAAALLQTLEHNRAEITWTALTPEEQTQLQDQARTAHVTASREESALRRAAISASSREAEAARAAKADRIARQQALAKLPKNSAQPNKPSAKRMPRPFRTRRKATGLVIAGILASPGKGMAIATDTAERVAEPGWTSGG